MLNAQADNLTLQIKNGTYSENLTIDRKTTLIAYPSHAPVIDGGSSKSPSVYVIEDAIIDGIAIKGSFALGEGSHYSECNVLISALGKVVTVINCVLSDWNHCGIKILAGRLIANGNTINAGGYTFQDHGIYIATGGLGGHEITNSELTGATGWGLHLYGYEYDAIVSGNNIHNNFGGVLVTGEGHTITGNTITDNLGGKGVNLFHYGLIGLTVTGNTLSGNTSHDLFLDTSEGEGLTNCTIADNTGTKNF